MRAERPVLADFWAPWRGPCRAVAPVIEELAREYQGKVTFAKLDTDRGERTAAAYGIMAIPTLIVFRGGREVTRLLGVPPQTVLERANDGAPGAPAPAPR